MGYIRMRFICQALEWLCCLTHPFQRIEFWVTGDYCHLSTLSHWLNKRYNLGVWKRTLGEADKDGYTNG